MSLFSLKPDLTIVKLIEEDLKYFIANELKLYRTSNSSDLLGCVITNMALLDPASLLAKEGQHRIVILFGGQSPTQDTAKRLRDFVAYLYIRYGESEIDTIMKTCLMVFTKLYGVDKDVIQQLHMKYNTFWILPIIKKCYKEIL